MATFLKILDKLGIDYIEKGRRLELLCQFHEDTRPSAAIYPDDGHFHCWKCGITYDEVQFVQHFKGISYQDARTVLESDFNYKPAKAKYDNTVVLHGRKTLEATLHANLHHLTRIQAGEFSEIIDKAEWAVRNGQLTEDKYLVSVGFIKRRIENACQ